MRHLPCADIMENIMPYIPAYRGMNCAMPCRTIRITDLFTKVSCIRTGTWESVKNRSIIMEITMVLWWKLKADFGHRHTNYTQYQRQGVAEEIFMNPDGTFDQAEMTSCGLNGSPLPGSGSYPAYTACVLYSKEGACKADVSIDKTRHPAVTQQNIQDDSGQHDPDEKKESFITNMQDGSAAGYKYFDLYGLKAVSVTVKSTAACTISVRTAVDGEDIAEIYVDACDAWKEFRAQAQVPDGKAALYFIHHGKGSLSFKSFTLTGTFV